MNTQIQTAMTAAKAYYAAHRWLSEYKEKLFRGHQNDPSHTVITEMIGPIRKPKI